MTMLIFVTLLTTNGLVVNINNKDFIFYAFIVLFLIMYIVLMAKDHVKQYYYYFFHQNSQKPAPPKL